MADPENLKRTVKLCMFDQYGTVVDMQGGLTKAAAPFLKSKGSDLDPHRFVTWWRRTVSLFVLSALSVALRGSIGVLARLRGAQEPAG